MCGIFGIVSSKKNLNKKDFKKLALLSRERGKDSSGFLTLSENYTVYKFNDDIKNTVNQILHDNNNLVIGHSRLITNSTFDNQPVLYNNIACVHNGIILNFEEIFKKLKIVQNLKIDTEIIPALLNYYLIKKISLDTIIDNILNECKGVINAAVIIPKLGKMLLFSNNGSLYLGKKNNNYYFSSEKFFLKKLNCSKINQISKKIIDIPVNNEKVIEIEKKNKTIKDIVPLIKKNINLQNLLIYEEHKLRRCTKCILPSTMPFIKFDEKGICNYCNNYNNKNFVKFNDNQVENIFNKYRQSKNKQDCIIPLSGGRDSCFSLHLAKKKFDLNPIAYTYDWGLVTDLARRNISRICSELNIEHIIFADNITKKRNYIKKNVSAWLKKPHLGMVNLFTAGDKHFFRHIKTVKKRTGLKLDLWGINPHELTHFKSGFLGIKPAFKNKNVYNSGIFSQLNYHTKRFYQMFRNPSYLNVSLFDNLYGEIFRSLLTKSDHYSIFDFYKWNENEVNEVLNLYDWEKATDTKSTWRIGDGAAAFYNYIYYTMAGFTENDTFRSNQIREGELSREAAIDLVKDENNPRYENIKWFLNIINLDYNDTIQIINQNKLKN